MFAERIGANCHFSYDDEKLGMFCHADRLMLWANMPHRQLLWPVAADAKLWFEAQKMARILCPIFADQRSREILR
jgi:hypothetical protein